MSNNQIPPPLTAGIPPPLSAGIPTLNTPSLSPIPPSLSPIPPSLSPVPPSLSPTPPSLSPTPPSLSPTPPSLSPTPPSLTVNQTISSNSSSVNISATPSSDVNLFAANTTTSATLVTSRAPAVIQPNEVPSKASVDDKGVPQLNLKPYASAPPTTSNKVITVSPTEDGVISAAAEAAEDGSTIVVQAGRYTECIRVNKSLRFVCVGKVSLRSDGLGEIFICNAPYVYIDGFHIKQDVSRARGAVSISSGTAHFNNCKINSHAFATIQIKKEGQLKCTSCRLQSEKCPILLSSHEAQIYVDQCVLQNSKTVMATLKGSTVALFSQCLFKNALKGGIISVEQTQIEVYSSTFIDSTVEVNSSGEVSVIKGCTFEGTNQSQRTGIVAAMNSALHIVVNNFTSSTIDCRDQSKVKFRDNRYNSSSLIIWGNSSAEAETETYSGDILGGAGAAISVSVGATLQLKKSNFNNINGYGVVSYDSTKCTLDLCRFSQVSRSAVVAHSGSQLVAADCDIQGGQEVGINLNQVHSASFTRVSVKDTASSGIEASGTNSLTLDGCKFENCRKCGIFISSSSGVVAKNIILDHNGYSGIHLSQSEVTFEGCTLIQNKKGGIFACQYSNAQINSCTFTRNEWAALFVEAQSKASLSKCTFQENVLSVSIAGEATMSDSKIVKQLQGGQAAPSLQVSGGSLECTNCQVFNSTTAAFICDNGRFVSNQTEFKDNKVHLEVTRHAEAVCKKCQFLNSTGNYAVKVSEDAKATLDSCEITGNESIGLVVEAEVDITNSLIKQSKKIGILCSGSLNKLIKDNEILNNGECGVQCNSGALSIINNSIKDHKKFGIYITAGATPAVEENKFEKNGLANIWHA